MVPGDACNGAEIEISVQSQIGGNERRHTSEQVGYVVFETAMVY